MSSGPSDRKLNPLCASSSCRLLTPKSASRQSRLPGSITPAASEKARGSNLTSGISLPSSALTSSSRAFASAIASGSRSKQISLPFGPSLLAISAEWPPSPTVASATTSPGRTLRYCKTSSKRTGTCCGLFILRLCAAPGGRRTALPVEPHHRDDRPQLQLPDNRKDHSARRTSVTPSTLL